LPDGAFSNQKSILGIFGGSCNGRRWYILWPFGLIYISKPNWYFWSLGLFYAKLVFYDQWEYFSGFGMLYQEQSGNPGPGPKTESYICISLAIFQIGSFFRRATAAPHQE
jgi:hypothetical protein